MFENLDKKDVARLIKPTIGNLHKFAIDYSDAIVQASPNINNSVINYAKSTGKEFLEYPGADNYINAYEELYDKGLNIISCIKIPKIVINSKVKINAK